MKFLRRIGAVMISAALSAGALMMFAGCSTDHPEVRITYTFNNKDYVVDYVLSRTDAPQTVKHFIELADAGFYNGLCIHDYYDNYLYGGGYRIIDEVSKEPFDYEENSEGTFILDEIDYFTKVKELDGQKVTFTQSVWYTAGSFDNPQKGEGTYTVYGESASKIDNQYGRDYSHSQGALVMYASDKGNFMQDVTVSRADGGKGNDGVVLQQEQYADNSATSLFYTYTGSSTISASSLGKTYCVFGMAKNYSSQLANGLLQDIKEYIEQQQELDEEYVFYTEQEKRLNSFEPFQDLYTGDISATFQTPILTPIIIKSVKVTKY